MSSSKDTSGKVSYFQGAFNQPQPVIVRPAITTVPPAGRTGKPGAQPPKPSNAAPTKAPR
jgi:hypothetical protein